MRKDNGIFGGEHSGHFYFRDNWFADSGLIAFLIMLELVSVEGKPLSEMLKPLDHGVRSGEINSTVNDVQGKLKALEEHFGKGAQSVDHLDGLTIDYRRLVVQRAPLQHRASAAPQSRSQQPGVDGTETRRSPGLYSCVIVCNANK